MHCESASVVGAVCRSYHLGRSDLWSPAISEAVRAEVAPLINAAGSGGAMAAAAVARPTPLLRGGYGAVPAAAAATELSAFQLPAPKPRPNPPAPPLLLVLVLEWCREWVAPVSSVAATPKPALLSAAPLNVCWRAANVALA